MPSGSRELGRVSVGRDGPVARNGARPAVHRTTESACGSSAVERSGAPEQRPAPSFRVPDGVTSHSQLREHDDPFGASPQSGGRR